MKTILVPTDFSANAEDALRFAVKIAKLHKASITLLNVYQMPIIVAPESFDLVQHELSELKTQSENSLKALVEKFGQHQVPLNYISEEGEPVETILNTGKTHKADLVVMGTRGTTGFGSGIFGSTTAKVMENAQCPVMAVPEGGVPDKAIRKLTYATDYKNSDIEAIGKLCEFARPWNATVNLLHIESGDISADEEMRLMDNFKNKILSKTAYANLSFQVMYGQDVSERLEDYVSSGSADIMVMSTHHRKFLERLFNKSVTREVMLKTPVPLIAFHYRKESSVKVF